MKCGGLQLGETDRNRNVEVERVILLDMSAADILKQCFLCPATFLGKHPHDLKPFALTRIRSESFQLYFLGISTECDAELDTIF